MSLQKEQLNNLLLSISFLGLAIFIMGGYYFFEKTSDKKYTADSQPVVQETPLHTKTNPVTLQIDGVKIDLPIFESKINKGVWETTQDGVSHLDISGNPGEGGNIVLYGHNKKRLLGSLPYVSMGARIKVITEDGTVHVYRVYSKRKVEHTDVSIALDTPNEVLTIYTCDDDNTKRFVLQAKPTAS